MINVKAIYIKPIASITLNIFFKKQGIFTGFFCLVVLGACTPTSSDSDPGDEISGIYIMNGLRTVETYPDGVASENEKPEPTQTNISLVIKVKLIDNNQDTIRFYGLEGADTGNFDEKVFSNCTMPEHCPVYTNMNDTKLEFDIVQDGRSYKGSGTITILNQTVIQLNTRFQDGNTAIEYDISGVRK